MRSTRLLPLIPALLSAAVQADERVDYVREIRPLLERRCYACHGALKQKAKLRLDTGAAVRKGSRNGPVVVPGDAAASELLQRVTERDEERRMPPEGRPLTPDEIVAIRRWIDQGAQSPRDEPTPVEPRAHWAFRRPARPPVPAVGDTRRVRNPIDAFVSAERDRRGLVPGPRAPNHVLLRRVHLDLTGLPPSRDELRAFLADPSDEAYEKCVDRLLASPHHGERWGRHWMDVWRYSDWYGRRAQSDVRNSYPEIWRWRDWIVESLNRDKGYGRMVQEMLAADEIAPHDDATIAATGFLVRNWYKLNYNQWMKDTVEHTCKAFLAITLNCAHCHDHKYDPFSQEEYFRFRAFFEPLELRQDRVPGLPDPGPFQDYAYGSSLKPIAAGMIRVYDKILDAPTYMYRLGDSRDRFEGRPPVTPGTPAALGGELPEVEEVRLPAIAHYPGLKPFIRDEETARLENAVDDARAKLAVASAALRPQEDGGTAVGTPASTKARLALTAAKAVHASAVARLAALEVRIAADRVRFEGAPGDTDALARRASRAERRAALESALAEVARAEVELATAREAVPAEPKAAQRVAAATKELAAARQRVVKAEAACLEESSGYAPLSPRYPQRSSGRRRALAHWIASNENPLTARVAANHIWLRHFGSALVDTVFDFGRNGAPPSHPELLDWLAVELMESGWRMKRLHRLIVTSETYRLSSAAVSPRNRRADPANRFLSRFNRRRMEAEVVRDTILYVAGGLDLTLGGRELDAGLALSTPRRSLYFSHHAEGGARFLEIFDAPDACDCYRRSESIVPQQALAMTNSQLTVSQGRELARAISEAPGGASDEVFLEHAFERLLSRLPSPAELEAATAFLRRQSALYRRTGPEALKAASTGAVAPSNDVHLRARESLIRSLFSHHDFVTIH